MRYAAAIKMKKKSSRKHTSSTAIINVAVLTWKEKHCKHADATRLDAVRGGGHCVPELVHGHTVKQGKQ
jgi:hypothetical protein